MPTQYIRVCPACMQPFPPAYKEQRYCSRSCANRLQRGTPIERFWAKVCKSDGCWEWTAGHVNGYGHFYPTQHKMVMAHIYSWQLHCGPVPDGLLVCHRCDNPACVRPDHLFLGTHTDNARDKVAKGRWHGQDRLTPDDVRAIRAAYAAGGVTWKALAARYGVKKATIGSLVHRRTWKHVV